MRFATLSLAVVLSLSAVSALAQSRTVSTANMPKPGVSYISGPGAPERQETVSTGTLPTPARLYVGGQVNTGSYESSSSQGGDYVDGGYYVGAPPYGGGYPGGNYPGNGYPDRGHDRPGGGWHDGDHDHDHGGQGHDNRPNPGNTVVVGGKSNPNRDYTRFNVAPVQDNNGRHDHDHGGGNGGWNNGFNNPNGPRPSINEPPPRAYNPGAGQSSVPLYQQPGSGPPPQIPRGASVPTRSR
ncbi:hypothetical protein L2Y96_03355 [Luteibacter aegosomaticola]|uniref:hypothetical protein n=1 Tax=Luteibacter aegosomaticola TaxID=2911538 RepID=UPI001FFBB370|nr:hypothetical protein [Luteibacter aegosomaticola]UPG90825.1 hypothetical protein L2Y96_03355 [Luteibacter aegosomaticola]